MVFIGSSLLNVLLIIPCAEHAARFHHKRAAPSLGNLVVDHLTALVHISGEEVHPFFSSGQSQLHIEHSYKQAVTEHIGVCNIVIFGIVGVHKRQCPCNRQTGFGRLMRH